MGVVVVVGVGWWVAVAAQTSFQEQGQTAGFESVPFVGQGAMLGVVHFLVPGFPQSS